MFVIFGLMHPFEALFGEIPHTAPHFRFAYAIMLAVSIASRIRGIALVLRAAQSEVASPQDRLPYSPAVTGT